ncbi:hypothetical protein Q5P01_016544 [Channa striata]|uniref:CCHC-type domain-containing protein n=1 Tax=Channa striata TaxID=64152 RepID=A0AA88SBQ4_CHASR|nr:hypothetical protein Q5P01_016544 [Channa striata]
MASMGKICNGCNGCGRPGHLYRGCPDRKRSFAEVVDSTGGAGVGIKDRLEEKRYATEVEEVEQQSGPLAGSLRGWCASWSVTGAPSYHYVTTACGRGRGRERQEEGNSSPKRGERGPPQPTPMGQSLAQ